MSISLFDLFSLGIGPSSSHTVGPMRAAAMFLNDCAPYFNEINRIQVQLYGSLALTGKGHGTDLAILNGLEGKRPEDVDPDLLRPRMQAIISNKQLNLAGKKNIVFDLEQDLRFLQKETLPKHSNALRFSCFDVNQNLLCEQVYYSVGGGFVVGDEAKPQDEQTLPYPFDSAASLLAHCQMQNLTISELMLMNEKVWRDEQDIHQGIKKLVQVMFESIDRGCQHEGILPGGLNVKRRAPDLYKKIKASEGSGYDHETILNKLNLYAIAVNEENAAGGRMVTAPTNGAAGVIPAVLRHLQEAHQKRDDETLYTYFLTAAAIGILYKLDASISGAEMGCQGEIGVASSMAAAGLTAAMGGSLMQIENAAEIAMEHHLGMTCDPVLGLVQLPCIERNAMGAVKAVNASRLALMGDGSHRISLDQVIKTMKQTGRDMMTIYKETSLGGLAVNVPEC